MEIINISSEACSALNKSLTLTLAIWVKRSHFKLEWLLGKVSCRRQFFRSLSLLKMASFARISDRLQLTIGITASVRSAHLVLRSTR